MILAIVRRDPGPIIAVLGRLRPDDFTIATVTDPGLPHEWNLAVRGLIGRSERGRPHQPELEAALRELAETHAASLAVAAATHGFTIRRVCLLGPAPREIEQLVRELAPDLLVLDRSRSPLPPHLRKLAERHPTLGA